MLFGPAAARVGVESRELRVRPAPGIGRPREDGLQSPPTWNQAAFEQLHYQPAAAGHRQKGSVIQGKTTASHEAQSSGTKSSGKPGCKLRHSISITAVIPSFCEQENPQSDTTLRQPHNNSSALEWPQARGQRQLPWHRDGSRQVRQTLSTTH